MRLDTLTRILDHQGPFASAMLDVSRTTEDAGRLLELRGKAARTGFARAGAPDSVADAVVERLTADRRARGHGAVRGRFGGG